jgi:hypothetical protein
MLFVRFTTELSEPKLAERIRQHAAACRAVPGLSSVRFGREATGRDLCAIYTFADESALQGFQRSETAYLLPTAFEVSAVRMDVIAPWPPAQGAPTIVEDEPLIGRIAQALVGGRIVDPDLLAAVVEPYVADPWWGSADAPGDPGRSPSRTEGLHAALARLSPADRRRLERIINDAHDHQPPAGAQPARTRVPARKGAQDDV